MISSLINIPSFLHKFNFNKCIKNASKYVVVKSILLIVKVISAKPES